MPTIFITSATGLQGTHLCQLLRKQDWEIHATTRDLSSPAAQNLISIGVNLAEGDWDNTTALQSSLQGCTHLFLNLMPNLSNLVGELPHAQSILSIAQQAGVKHVVYSSAFGSSLKASSSSTTTTTNTSIDTNNPFADPTSLHSAVQRMKSDIEHLVATHSPPFETYTILRPAFFMANMFSPRVNFMYSALLLPVTTTTTTTTRTWKTALLPTTRVPMVDPLDIARFAATALQSPHDPNFNRQIIPVYNELLTPAQLLEILGESVNKILGEKETQWHAKFDTEEEVEARKEAMDIMVHVQLHMRKISDDIELTGEEIQEKWGIKMGTFREYLAREEELVRKTYGAAQEGGEAIPAGGYTRD